MKDVKYKAWDKIDKKMHTVTMLDVSSRHGKEYSSVYFEEKTSHNNGHRRYTEIELLEYTGIIDDKKTKEYPEGQEIYKGYIVKVTDGEWEINELDSNTGIGVVEWLNDWGMWNVSEIENSLGDLKQCYHIEVIGNKWEHPELLEK